MTDEPKAAADIPRKPEWPAPKNAEPGWKVDPTDRKRLRYWDGGDWGGESLTHAEVSAQRKAAEPQRVVVEQKKKGTGCATFLVILLIIGGIGAIIDSCRGSDDSSSSSGAATKQDKPAETKPEGSVNMKKAEKLLKSWGAWEKYSILKLQPEGGNLVVLTELWPKPSNEPAATGICTLLIGDDPPEINVTSWVMVWNPVADAEIKSDSCDVWHWDQVHGR